MPVADTRPAAFTRPRASALYSLSPKPPLRVGLLFCAGGLRPGYGVLLRALAACEAATIVCLVAYAPPSPAARRRSALALHERLDRRLVRRHRRFEDVPADPQACFPAAENLSCEARSVADRWAITPEAAGRIGDLGLDVLLALDRSGWCDEVATLARDGLWHFGWNDRGAEDLDHVLFDSVCRGQPLIFCQLRRRTGKSADQGIASMAVAGHARSLAFSRDRAFAGAAFLAPRALRRLRRDSPLPVEAVPDATPPGTPGPWAVADLAARQAWRWLRFRHEYRHAEWWFLAMRTRPDPAAAESMAGFRRLPSAPGRYYADPFLIEERGKTHVFFEDFDRRLDRACISHAELSEEGMPGPVLPALERPYHLSYPFVFRWQGQIWMVPETGTNRAVELYHSEEFPLRWSLHRTLLQGWKAVDATLHEDEAGRWWMFVTVSEDPRGAGALFLFMADSPLGPWQAHPANPVQTDIRHARPGGRLFRSEGRLLRPAQDCSLRYGGALWLMEVTALTSEVYREMPLRRLDPLPFPGNLCLHHRDATARFEFVDGMQLSPTDRPG